MAKLSSVVLIVFIALVAILSCSNDKGTNPGPMSATAVVSGKVLAGGCIPYPPPDSPWARPYTEVTGYPATLDFYGPDGTQYATATDSQSAYSVKLDTGMYTVVVEYWHGWPVRYHNMHIGADTTFDPVLLIAYMWPDTVICSFTYDSTTERLTEQEELDYLESLNIRSAWSGSPPMNLEAANRIVYEFDHGFARVNYNVPPRESWRVWEVVDVCRSTLLQFPNQFPDYFEVNASLVYCIDYDKPAAGPVDIDCGGASSP